MERTAAQCGVTVETRSHLHQRKHLAGTLAGAKEEVEQETLEVGATSLVETGGNSTLKRPREAGMPRAPLPRIHRLVLGAEL